MRITYNSPVVLTYAFASLAVLGLTALAPGLMGLFASSGNLADPGNILYIFAHANLMHFAANMMLFLLLAPLIEEKYGSPWFLLMIAATAIATSVLNAVFFHSGIIGASGIVFMLIILSSITTAGASR
jgi:hypothetical protein